MEEPKKNQQRIRPKTFSFQTGLRWLGGRKGELRAGEAKPALLVGSPPEFKGDPENLSPEDLFLAAISVCQMTTFVALAERAGLEFSSYEDSCQGVMEVVEGKLVFTRVVLHPKVAIRSAEDRDRALELINEAHKKCAIANSASCEVEVEPEIIVV
ncbi:MAG: hypothetical protein A2Y63_01525 [Candidatus Riflebacteria bacterium RBG_13_59_9]|nr:MAG: hypothetical protein A2Y63_01525 [Candidatus Riflebacteria bacterium RBG_13_59_9]